jgi:pilus assembly protein CpaF
MERVMKLSERLMQIEEAPAAAESVSARNGDERSKPKDPLAEFKTHAREALFAKLQAKSIDSSMDDRQLRAAVMTELQRLMADSPTPLTPEERERMSAEISEDIVGYGPIGRFLEDHSITEVMVNGVEGIFIEREGRIIRTDVQFSDEDHLRHVIDRIVARVGRRIDESSPMVDARLPDGSRVNAVIPPLAVDGSSLTIRKFSKDPYTSKDLIAFGTLSPPMAALLRACVEGKLNILITGGTGTGKTTLLNVLSGFIPIDERIVTIEDAVELQLQHDDLVRLESRPPNVEGRGEVTIRDLVRNALRMRPDRIVVGEVRGPEALDMLQAMNTGHEGSLSTVHANTPRDAMNRLETMVLMAGIEIPVNAIRDYISSALSLIVHLTRMRDGSRRVTQVTEVVGMEGDIITMQDIFRFRYRGVDDERRILGHAEPTGIRPKFVDHFKALGIELPSEVFGPNGVVGNGAS